MRRLGTSLDPGPIPSTTLCTLAYHVGASLPEPLGLRIPSRRPVVLAAGVLGWTDRVGGY